jgi:hypothetical protein
LIKTGSSYFLPRASPGASSANFGDKMNLVSILYKAARTANDVSKVSSGKPSKVAKRAANKAVGRSLLSKLFFK